MCECPGLLLGCDVFLDVLERFGVGDGFCEFFRHGSDAYHLPVVAVIRVDVDGVVPLLYCECTRFDTVARLAGR